MRMRNLVALATAGALAAGGGSLPGKLANRLAGGDLEGGAAKVSGTVTMWIYPILTTGESAYWKSKVKAFEKVYPDVDVNVVVQPWANRDEQLTTAIAGDSGPDVVYLIPDQVPNYANQGTLVSLSSVVKGDRSDFLPQALKAMTFNGTLYGVPLLMSTNELMVNKKAMHAVGLTHVPTTWGQLLADAPKIKQAGYYATEYDADLTQTLNLTFYPLLWEAGGAVLNDGGKKAAFNSSAGVAALTFLKKLVDRGYVPPGPLTIAPTTGTDPVSQGKVVFVMTGDVAEMSSGPLPLSDWAVYPPLKDKYSVSYGTVGGLSVLSGSHNKPAAEAWVKWVTSTSEMKVFDKTHHYYPPRKSVGQLFARSTMIGKEERLLPDMYVGSINIASRQLMDLIKPQIQAALLGKETPKRALDNAASSVDSLLARSS
jgi:multiple sugar transport system substrate-binding protein